MLVFLLVLNVVSIAVQCIGVAVKVRQHPRLSISVYRVQQSLQVIVSQLVSKHVRRMVTYNVLINISISSIDISLALDPYVSMSNYLRRYIEHIVVSLSVLNS